MIVPKNLLSLAVEVQTKFAAKFDRALRETERVTPPPRASYNKSADAWTRGMERRGVGV